MKSFPKGVIDALLNSTIEFFSLLLYGSRDSIASTCANPNSESLSHFKIRLLRCQNLRRPIPIFSGAECTRSINRLCLSMCGHQRRSFSPSVFTSFDRLLHHSVYRSEKFELRLIDRDLQHRKILRGICCWVSQRIQKLTVKIWLTQQQTVSLLIVELHLNGCAWGIESKFCLTCDRG